MINFIVNIKSGKGRGERTLKKLREYCSKNNIEYTAHITESVGHATRIAKVLNSEKVKTIVAVGGDGTFSEVLNGIDCFDTTALGFIPAGRGNDYARAARLKLKPLDALKDILRGEICCTDYIDVSGKRCLNVAGSGLDVAVLERVAGKSDKLSYLKSLWWCLNNYKPYNFNIKIDDSDEVINHDCVMVGVCNGTAIGGGIKLSPKSKIDDGKLNLIIMLPPKNLLNALLTFKKGKHMDKYYTKHYLCESVSVECTSEHQAIQLDGEISKELKLCCRVVKGGIRTFKIR